VGINHHKSGGIGVASCEVIRYIGFHFRFFKIILSSLIHRLSTLKVSASHDPGSKIITLPSSSLINRRSSVKFFRAYLLLHLDTDRTAGSPFGRSPFILSWIICISAFHFSTSYFTRIPLRKEVTDNPKNKISCFSKHSEIDIGFFKITRSKFYFTIHGMNARIHNMFQGFFRGITKVAEYYFDLYKTVYLKIIKKVYEGILEKIEKFDFIGSPTIPLCTFYINKVKNFQKNHFIDFPDLRTMGLPFSYVLFNIENTPDGPYDSQLIGKRNNDAGIFSYLKLLLINTE
jgi:hypothetical protein